MIGVGGVIDNISVNHNHANRCATVAKTIVVGKTAGVHTCNGIVVCDNVGKFCAVFTKVLRYTQANPRGIGNFHHKSFKSVAADIGNFNIRLVRGGRSGNLVGISSTTRGANCIDRHNFFDGIFIIKPLGKVFVRKSGHC